MEEQSLAQLRSFWPDVAAPFSRVIPDGCFLIHTIDDWSAGLSAMRRRLIDLARLPDCPDLEALVEEACEDAQRRGWTIVDEYTTREEHVFELEDVLLRIRAARVKVLGNAMPVLRVAFDQPWPADAGAPVETSEMFQNLVRKLLRLGAPPDRLIKEVTADLTDLAQIDTLREAVELAKDHDLTKDLAKLSFTRDAESWVSKTTSGVYDVVARVREKGAKLEIEMEKSRIVN